MLASSLFCLSVCLSISPPCVDSKSYYRMPHVFSPDFTSDSKCCAHFKVKGIMCDTGMDNLSRWQLARITGPVVFFSIILPLVDNVTDLILIVKLYFGVNYCKHYCFSPSTYGLKTCEGYFQCRENATTYCNNLQEPSNDESCQFRRYTTLATSLLCKI